MQIGVVHIPSFHSTQSVSMHVVRLVWCRSATDIIAAALYANKLNNMKNIGLLKTVRKNQEEIEDTIDKVRSLWWRYFRFGLGIFQSLFPPHGLLYLGFSQLPQKCFCIGSSGDLRPPSRIFLYHDYYWNDCYYYCYYTISRTPSAKWSRRNDADNGKGVLKRAKNGASAHHTNSGVVD